MCGILAQCGGKINKKRFILARDTMEKRGPDDAGVFYDEKNSIALGHRRLSIIDLSSAGKQPMRSADGRYVIVFNGEIFNFVELKKELSDYVFRTDSDTEVLLAAYINWGPDCLKKLNGQFAFAIYDTRDQELFFARDHFGIKPLYYAIHNGGLILASEIKALLKLGFPAVPNDKIIYEFLRYSWYDHSSETFFEGIKRLLPGQYAIWRNNSLSVKTYWDLAMMQNREGEYDHLSEGEAINLFKALMSDAIRLQFRSDVPVGMTMSSGLDSMSMLFFANSVVGGDIRLYSGGLADPKYDETRELKSWLSRRQNKYLTTSVLAPDKIWPLAKKLLKIQDEPYGGFSTINYFNLYDMTGIPGVTVLLEGQGADELLGGYRYYKNSQQRNNLSQDMTKEGAPVAIPKAMVNKFGKHPLIFPAPFKSALLNMQYKDLRYIKMPRVLRFNDHISLAYSKELRVPYLDHRLAEFCFFLPKKFKIQGDSQKVLLRKAMAGIVPPPSKNKQKVFFGAFQTDWFRKYFQKEASSFLNSKSFQSRPYWEAEVAKKMAERFFHGEGENSFFLWQWINLEMWLREFID